MGFQFGDSFRLSDELNKFSAVRRDEMAGRGCQVLSLLDSYVVLSTTFIVFDWIASQTVSGSRETVLQILMGEKTPKRYFTD
jgi:hypothetical protein